jgi:hypothetical protein
MEQPGGIFKFSPVSRNQNSEPYKRPCDHAEYTVRAAGSQKAQKNTSSIAYVK